MQFIQTGVCGKEYTGTNRPPFQRLTIVAWINGWLTGVEQNLGGARRQV